MDRNASAFSAMDSFKAASLPCFDIAPQGAWATDDTKGRSRRMSIRSTASRFVELCRAGKNFDVMRTMYAPDIVSVEADGKETAGQGRVIKKSEDWVSDKEFHGETVAGPFFNGANPNQFTVYFTLDVTPKATGQRKTLEEIGVYTVSGED